MKKFLVLLDTPSIKQYVFESAALKEIRGASAILDGLNRGWLLGAHENTEAEAEQAYRRIVEQVSGVTLSRLVYANGGSGLLLLQAADESAMEKVAQCLARQYHEYTAGAVSLLVAWEPYDEQSDDLQACLVRVHWRMRRKRATRWIAPLLGTPWCRYDARLKNHRAQKLYIGPDDSPSQKYHWISAISWQRIEFARKKHRRVWQELEQIMGQLEPPKTLADIGGRDQEDSDIAVVYADGNAMGKNFRALTSLDDYQELSAKIDRAVRQATFTTLQDLFGQQITRQKNEGLKARAPFDIILLGGDDILLVLPPAKAADFVLQTHKNFSQQVDGAYSLSFGIAVAHCHVPFAQLVDQAGLCLKNAKKHFSGEAAVDFQLNRGAFYPDIHSYRQREWYKQALKIKLSCRPFDMATFERYVEQACNLKKADVPFSRLHRIARGLQKGRNLGHAAWIEAVGHASCQAHSRALLGTLRCWNSTPSERTAEIDRRIEPWRQVEEEYICGWQDVLDLYELLRTKAC